MLTITKERVLEAASKCETAKATLKALFPECFDVKKQVQPGQIVHYCGLAFTVVASDDSWLTDNARRYTDSGLSVIAVDHAKGLLTSLLIDTLDASPEADDDIPF